MCCCIPGDPIEDPSGRLKTFERPLKFQRSMLWAPCASCSSFFWFCGQFLPCTCGITQCLLRRKVLGGDMTKYSCFQGYFDCCGLHAGSCGEQSCPTFCSFLEGCCCNCFAVSASRFYVMEKYDLGSDPCDYRLIRINNCLQLMACVCNILAIFIAEIRDCAAILNRIADIFYQCVSGCMTAQTAYEVDYRANAPTSSAFAGQTYSVADIEQQRKIMAQYEQQEKKQQDYAPYEYQPQQQPEAQATSQYHQEYIPVADAVDIQPSAPTAAAAPISNRYA